MSEKFELPTYTYPVLNAHYMVTKFGAGEKFSTLRIITLFNTAPVGSLVKIEHANILVSTAAIDVLQLVIDQYTLPEIAEHFSLSETAAGRLRAAVRNYGQRP